MDLNGNILTSANGVPLYLNSFNLFTDVKEPNRTGIDPIWFGPQYLAKYMPLPNDYTVGDGLNTAGFRWQRQDPGIDGATGQSPNPNRNHITTRFDYQSTTTTNSTSSMTREHDYGVTGQTGSSRLPYWATSAMCNGTLISTPRRGPGHLVEHAQRIPLRAQTGHLAGNVGERLRMLLERRWGTDLAATAAAARASFPQVGGQFLYTQAGWQPGAGGSTPE